MGTGFRIKRLTNPESFKQLELLQMEVWGRGEVIPYHVLIAFQKMGGIVLAAIDDGGRPIGMLCGYNSFQNGKVYHYMHLCGVVPEMREQGVATALKKTLREHLLSQGIELAKWLIDPLQIPEAYLSLHRLGALGRRYVEHFYGTMRDPYNRGLESDRLEVVWKLRSRRVEDRVAKKEPEVTVKDLIDEGAKRILTTLKIGAIEKVLNYRLNVKDDRILLEIPANIDQIKRLDISVATEWRNVTRKIFKKYIEEGYTVTDLLRDTENGRTRYYYLIEKNPDTG